MSIKIERLNHTYQEVISEILMTEIKDQDIKFVTITGVDITNDLSFAKVYFTILNEEYKNETLDQEKKESTKEALERASSFIRTKLAEKVDIRHTPELRFIYDTSIAYGEHIDKIIEKINEKDKN